MALTTRRGRIANRPTPTVVAMATWTAKAPAAPNHTARGRPVDANTRDANMVLSGSSPTKITGKTAATMANFMDTSRRGEGVPALRAPDVAAATGSPGRACAGYRVATTQLARLAWL